MNWIGPALVSEGPSDDRFLGGIIGRSLEHVLARAFDDVVVVGDVISVRASVGPSSISDSVRKLVENVGSYNLVVYHHDGGSNRQRVLREWVEPMRAAWLSTGVGDPLVFILPVQETEAWPLADGDALREVFGLNLSDAALGVPTKPGNVSQMADRKRTLKEVSDRAGGRQSDCLTRLGEVVSLERLAEVDAFREWLDELTCALAGSFPLRRSANES